MSQHPTTGNGANPTADSTAGNGAGPTAGTGALTWVSVRTASGEEPAVRDPGRGVCLVRDLIPDFGGGLIDVMTGPRRDEILRRAADADDGRFLAPDTVSWAPPYRDPPIIWGIGLNYVDHAADLSEVVPDEPASFLKGRHTIIGPGDPITVPPQSQRTTAEAELGLVVGRRCRNIEPEQAMDHIAGFTTVLDQTAEDILARNPRFLTRSKNFPGFFSFGPEIIPVSSLLRRYGALSEVKVATVINGTVHRDNTVSRMRYSPEFLLSFHSKVMELPPGAIISTGTPGARVIGSGDVVECRIEGFLPLRNPVR
ncbi:MAG: fumarylacetoacetate hydrolase family protein [Micromonosporaceae bacterium]